MIHSHLKGHNVALRLSIIRPIFQSVVTPEQTLCVKSTAATTIKPSGMPLH
jgi:hypothetical protein